jgi:hypothetical protein
MTTLKEFEEMVRRHDLTYEWSDDHSCWKSGQFSYNRIRQAAAELPQEDVVRIWNEVVDEKVSEFSRSMFYWKVKT